MSTTSIEKQQQNVLKWVEALRSGKYKQGQGALNYNNEKFCCLGVACEIFKDEYNIKKTKTFYIPPPIITNSKYFSYNGNNSYLTPKTKKILGIRNSIDTLFANMNDNDEFDFNTIANIIMNEWENFFTHPKPTV